MMWVMNDQPHIEGEVDESLAPRWVEWHRLYATNNWKITQLLAELREHPAFEDAEDLGDWVETMETLQSFRPRTKVNIERETHVEVYGYNVWEGGGEPHGEDHEA